jgi:hypothetical protein
MTKYTPQRLFEMMNRVGGMPLTEVDWTGEFGDVKQTSCMNIEELKNLLNDVLKNYNRPPAKRVKSDLYIHNKAIKHTPEGDIDVQQFINDISVEPDSIMSTGNKKMLKSTTDKFYTVTISLPAFRGLVFDKEHNSFHIISTCPGAGACARPCYARRGNYVRLTNVFLKQTRILNLLLNNPERFKAKLKNEIKKTYFEFEEKEMRFRWNDSGDFFSKRYFEIGKEIMAELKQEGFVVRPYAHTKVASIYNASREGDGTPDFIVSFSVDANKRELGKVNLQGAKTSEIVPPQLFKDLFVMADKHNFAVDDNDHLIFKSVDGMDILKQRIAEKFNVDPSTLLSHDEMMQTPEADKPTYNVIVMPKGETDISTQRPDVLRTFFLQH